MADNFFTGFAQGVEMRRRREDRELSSRLSVFNSQYSDYMKAQADDRERLEQARNLAQVHLEAFKNRNLVEGDVNIKSLERAAYDMLGAGYDSKYIGEQFNNATFLGLQNNNIAVDPMDTATTTTGPNIPTISEGRGQEIDAEMGAVDSQMQGLGLDNDTLWERVKTTESNNSHFTPEGAVVTSSKGALGIAQVMPKTAMDPGNNVPSIFDMATEMGIAIGPRTEETAAELLANEELNEKFGRAYFDAMQNRFGNDPVKTLIAYNAGPEVAEEFTGDRSTLPQETQGYLVKTLGLADTPVTTSDTGIRTLSEEDQEQDRGLLSPITDAVSGVQGLVGGFLDRIAQRSNERVEKRFSEALNLPPELVAEIKQGYRPGSRAEAYFRDDQNTPISPYVFEPAQDPSKLPDWRVTSKITASNYQSLAAAATEAGDDNRASFILQTGRKIVSGEDFFDTGSLDEDNVALRIRQLDRAYNNGQGNISQERYNSTMEDLKAFRSQVTMGDPMELLKGVTNDNLENKILLLATGDWSGVPQEDLDTVSDALFESYLKFFLDLDMSAISWEDLATRRLKLDAEIEGASPELRESLLQTKDFFETSIVPKYEDALVAAGIERKDAYSEDMTLPQVYARLSDLERRGVGPDDNNAEYQALQDRLDGFTRVEEESRIASIAEDSDKNDPEYRQVITTDGRIIFQTRTGTDPQTGQSVYTSNEPLDDSQIRRTLTSEERDAFDRATSVVNDQSKKASDFNVRISQLVDPTADILEIIEKNPEALAAVGGFQSGLLNLITNIRSFGSLATPEGLDQFNEQARGAGLFEELNSDTVLGLNMDRLAAEGGDAALLRAKLLLMAYRVGAAEGQTGQGMSNRDAERFQTIIQASRNANAFRENLVGFVESKLNEADLGGQAILSTPAVRGFNSQFPDSPLLEAFTPIPVRELLQNDPRLGSQYETYVRFGVDKVQPISTFEDFKERWDAELSGTVLITDPAQLERLRAEYPEFETVELNRPFTF